MSWFVYVLRCKDNSLYTGITTDVERRFQEHKSEKTGAKYTKSKKPVEIAYTEKFDSRSDAASREFAIKRLSKIDKEKLVSQKLGHGILGKQI
jgi:putative endonuclease